MDYKYKTMEPRNYTSMVMQDMVVPFYVTVVAVVNGGKEISESCCCFMCFGLLVLSPFWGKLLFCFPGVIVVACNALLPL